MKVGRFEVFLVSDGTFALDGGAMFGVVPKVLWERTNPADARNRIALALGCLLVRTPSGRWVLVDTGLSDKYEKNQKFVKTYAVRRAQPLARELRGHGLEAADISLVINTHLHFDHCGGNTIWDETGARAVPTFRKAKYLIQEAEWEDALSPNERNRASYLLENYACLKEHRQLELVRGEYEIEPGLKVLLSGGHTRGHQCVLVESEGQGAIFLGDLIPTRSHLPAPYIMGYDLFPLDTLHAKKRLLQQAQERNWMILFQHDPQQRSGYLREQEGRPVLVPTSS